METLHTRGRDLEIPSSVSELSPEQYTYYCFLASALASGVLDLDGFRVRWLSYLAGMGRADFTLLRPKFRAEMEAQTVLVDGFIRRAGEGVTLDFETPVNLLPEYGGYSGPGDWLEGVTFGEFVECLTVLENTSDEDESARQEAYEHVARVLYHVPDSSEVPDLLVFHAPTFLSSVWKALMADPVEINGRKIDFRIIFKGSGNSRPDDRTGWTGITFEIASAGLFGNVREVEKTDLWTVLLYLYKCRFEALHERRTATAK